MDKVLFIIDMQEMYAGRGRNTDKYRYDSEDLIDRINKLISSFKPEEVFYFKSIAKGLGGLMGGMPKAGTHEAKFAERLKLVGKNVYERSKADVFALDEIVDLMRSRNVKEVELTGVDANNSVSLTAISATNDLDLRVVYHEDCIVSPVPEKTNKLKEKIKRNRVTFL
ncbi:MAG: cysteine hydrolase [Ruminococcus sp.]|nr:cysteine hydrolase [Ruminococcus sp.]